MPDLKKNNSAVADLLERLSQNPRAFAVIVAGPSGVGKTTVCREVLAASDDIRRCVTTTTRPPRDDEVEGVERHFVSKVEFLAKLEAGQFIEHAEVHNHLYGATLDSVFAAMDEGRVMLMDVDVQGVATWQKALGDRCVTVFVLPPTLQKLEDRLASRQSETAEAFDLRMKNAIAELRKAHLCDYIIVNDDLDDAVARLMGIIRAERQKTSRMQKYITDLSLDFDVSEG